MKLVCTCNFHWVNRSGMCIFEGENWSFSSQAVQAIPDKMPRVLLLLLKDFGTHLHRGAISQFEWKLQFILVHEGQNVSPSYAMYSSTRRPNVHLSSHWDFAMHWKYSVPSFLTWGMFPANSSSEVLTQVWRERSFINLKQKSVTIWRFSLSKQTPLLYYLA